MNGVNGGHNEDVSKETLQRVSRNQLSDLSRRDHYNDCNVAISGHQEVKGSEERGRVDLQGEVGTLAED